MQRSLRQENTRELPTKMEEQERDRGRKPKEQTSVSQKIILLSWWLRA